MANRKYAEVIRDARKACCYWSSENQEHSVTFYQDNVKLPEATYYTSDRQDALDTANRFVNEGK